MADMNIDTLTIEIETNAKNAAEQINSLSSSLKQLKNALSRNDGNGLQKLGDNLSFFSARLQEFDVERLKAISDAVRELKSVSGGKITMPKIAGAKTFTNKVMQGGVSGNQASAGANVPSVNAKTPKAKENKKSSSSLFGNLGASLGRIAMYRALRTVLKALGQVLTDGYAKLYEYGKIAGSTSGEIGKFSDSVIKAKAMVSSLSASIAAITAPVVNVFAPAFEWLEDTIIDVSNAIAKFNASFSDGDYIEINKDKLDDYTEAVERAKTATLGFDELNVLSGFQADYFEDENVFNAEIDETQFKASIELLDEIAKYEGTHTSSWTTDENLSAKFKEIAKAAGYSDEEIKTFLADASKASSILTSFNGKVVSSKLKIDTSLDITPDDRLLLNKIYGLDDLTAEKISKRQSEQGVVGTAIANIVQNATDGVTTTDKILGGVLSGVGGIVSTMFGSLKSALGFASGGFPEDGLFFANHNELVGSFNGRSAVVNNEQIIEGVSQGVYNAVVSAMQNSNSGSNDVKVYLDGKQIYNSVVNTNTRNGAQIGRLGLVQALNR